LCRKREAGLKQTVSNNLKEADEIVGFFCLRTNNSKKSVRANDFLGRNLGEARTAVGRCFLSRLDMNVVTTVEPSLGLKRSMPLMLCFWT
jgi:hypothetical protein